MKEGFAILIFYSFLVGGSGVRGSMLDKYSQRPDGIYHGRYTRDVHAPELLVPRRVLEDGSFLTYLLPKFYNRQELNDRKKRSLDNDDGADKLHLVLPFNGEDHHVELMPHHEFISPGMVVEARGEGSATNLNEGIRFSRAPDEQCHYKGIVRGHDNSRAALSLCEGVAGYVQTDQGRYFIEPLSEAEPGEDGQHVHMLYRREAPHEKEQHNKQHCGTGDDWESAWTEQLQKRQERLANKALASKRSGNTTSNSGSHSIHRYIELTIIADRRFLDYHNGTNYEQYILTIMNMVADYYHDSSAGNQIDIVVVRMIYLEQEKKELDLYISPEAEKTLDSFSKWADKMNPKDDNHPNHHDIGVLITRYDICSETTSCDLLGLAYVAAACDATKAACINEDAGLVLGIVITHEVGHVMGCSHDTTEISGCKEQDKDDSYFVMSPVVFIYTIRWSPCSRKFITSFLENGLGDCLNDDPKNPNEKYKITDMLPGAMYDADFQCNLEYPGHTMCKLGKGNLCEALWCKNGTGTQCTSNGAPPAEGTKCGENKWCIRKQCVPMGERPKAIAGGWGDWGPMGECSRTCGGGVKTQERECNKPMPQNGGRYCLGERKRATTCNTSPCDEKAKSFRAVQCLEYDKKKVLTDGNHKWEPYLPDGENPCVLHCINEKHTFVKASPTAKDGTPCKGGTNHMCVSGVCRKVGCDWVMDSEALEDQCGICKGDGTQCTAVEGVYNKTGVSGYQKIVTVPKQSRSIMLMELGESDNSLAIMNDKGGSYCLNGNNIEQKNGEYPCAGAIIFYDHPEPQREEAILKGPITEDIQLQYAFYTPSKNPGVRYRYYVKGANSSYVPKYEWDFVEWSPCDSKCGGGTEISEAACIEAQGGQVTSSFCSSIPRPEPKSRICNEQPCGAKWRVSQWSHCSACGGKTGVKRRKVQCVKPAPHPGDEDVQANFDSCKGNVPKQTENCTGTRPCKKMCNKKTRSDTEGADLTALADVKRLSLDEQRKIIDKFVDMGLARYLERPDISPAVYKSEKRNIADDFRHLLHDWATTGEDKYKRTCGKVKDEKDEEAGKDDKKIVTPKPGSIVKDVETPDRIVLMEAPIRDEYLKSNLSDEAFREEGDFISIGIDTQKEKIYKGAEAAKRIKAIAHHDIPPFPGTAGAKAGGYGAKTCGLHVSANHTETAKT